MLDSVVHAAHADSQEAEMEDFEFKVSLGYPAKAYLQKRGEKLGRAGKG